MKLAVVVNLRARKGSDTMGALVRRFFPRARLALTRTLDETRAWIAQHLRPDPPELLLAAGGDGTITALLNELTAQGLALPPLGVLPLGTGNAWARVVGAPRPRWALQRLAALRPGTPPPLRRFHLVRVGGQLAPFAGTGWDAEMLNDYKSQLARLPSGPLREAHAGLKGYLAAMVKHTLPRHLRRGGGNPQVSVYNLGEPALTVGPGGTPQPLPHAGTGALLYRGPAGVAGAATTPEWGFGFKAYPFAQAVPGRMSVRIYGADVLEATRQAFHLWRGAHPLPRMHDFLVQRVRMDFDREVPLQVAGDVVGLRRSVEFELADEAVQMLDWRQLAAAAA